MVYRSTVLPLPGNYSLADLRNISLHKWNVLVSQMEKAMAPHSSTLLPGKLHGWTFQTSVHGVTKSGTPLSDFTFTFHFPELQKETATHSSVLAWRIPGTGEPGGLMSMGSHRVRHNWSDLAAAAAAVSQNSSVPLWLCLELYFL